MSMLESAVVYGTRHWTVTLLGFLALLLLLRIGIALHRRRVCRVTNRSETMAQSAGNDPWAWSEQQRRASFFRSERN
jgi:hypothetical protein